LAATGDSGSEEAWRRVLHKLDAKGRIRMNLENYLRPPANSFRRFLETARCMVTSDYFPTNEKQHG
jgi:hypothetical protein